ncbi:MAG: DUF547 domain-containing protein [Haloferacaceae archaeon]
MSDRSGATGGVDPAPAADQPPARRARLLLEAIRDGEPPGPHLAALAAADHDALAPVRSDRATALAFWLNLYNAGTQLLLARREDPFGGPLGFLRFFRTSCVTVAGTDLGLDDIEQGVLRGSRSKYGLGYLPRLRPSAFERRYRLSDPDPRIHFALNCGAASCPAIRAYDPERVDDQLDAATRAYLDGTVEYDPASGVARVPRVFLWYRGDFGGGRGIRAFLRDHGAVPADAEPRLRYRSWDWTPTPGKFRG